MMGDFDGFDWDEGNREKCRKHGVSLQEIEELFDIDPIILPDIAHSHAEQRFYAVGRLSSLRHLFVVFTLRIDARGKMIRPISARFMHRKEINTYEKAIPRS
jgi:uncharacterized DUF497 family protein